MTVLVLAQDQDPSVDKVVEALFSREIPVFRADTAWFPRSMSLDAEIGAGSGGGWSGRLATERRILDLADVRSVWYRAPSAFALAPALDAAQRRHAMWEAKLGLGGVLVDLSALWVDHPSAAAAAAYKPHQLAVADAAGLLVPPTLITNRADAAREFTARYPAVVVKPLGFGSVVDDRGRAALYTHVLEAADLADLAGIEITAHQLQAFVADKMFEARVTVVGKQILAASIRARTAPARLDWRRDYSALVIEPIEVPSSVASGIRHLMRGLGLRFAALDFVVDTDRRWWYLEANVRHEALSIRMGVKDPRPCPVTAGWAKLEAA